MPTTVAAASIIRISTIERAWLAGVLDSKLRFTGHCAFYIRGDPDLLAKIIEVAGVHDPRRCDTKDQRRLAYTSRFVLAKLLAIALPYMKNSLQIERANAAFVKLVMVAEYTFTFEDIIEPSRPDWSGLDT